MIWWILFSIGIVAATVTGMRLREKRRKNRPRTTIYAAGEKNLIFQKVKIPIWLLDAAGNQLMVNPAVCEMTGLDEKNILATDCNELFCKEPKAPKWCPLRRVITEHTPTTCQLSLNGREYTINAEPIFDNTGKIIRILKTAVDITERIAAERREQTSRQILQALLDDLPVAVTLKDADNDFRYLLCNPAYCKMVDRQTAELLGKTDAEIGLFSERGRELRAIDERVMERQTIMQNTLKISFPHSGRIVCERFKIPLKSPGGKRMLLVVYMDVTKQHNLVESEKIINQSLEHVVVEPDFIKNSAEVMQALAKHMGCDRISFMEYDQQKNTYRELHRIVAEPEERNTNFSVSERMRLLERLSEPLKQNKLVCISDVADSPVAEILSGSGLLSACAVPVFVGSDYCGALFTGFSIYRRVFSEIDQRIMRSMANIISLAVIRKRQMNELNMANREKLLILNNINIPIWLYDSAGQLVRVNSAVCKMTGLDEAANLAIPCRELICKDTLKAEECPVKQALLDGKSHSRSLHYNGRDYILNAEPVIDDDGLLINVVQSAVDVTEIEEAKRQQEAAAKQAEKANKIKSYFIASVSHELRTPLNAVLGSAELLRDANIAPSARTEFLTNISTAGNMLLLLINNVLEISQMETGFFDLTPSPTDFSAICNDVTAIFNSRIVQKKLTVNIDLQPMPRLMLDHARISQILFNLLDNAVKFTNSGAIGLFAEFRPENAASGSLIVKISDSGPGIPPDKQDELFTTMFSSLTDIRGAHATSSGSGIGLAVTAKLLEHMNGTITLEKSSPAGSVFAVKLHDLKIASVQPTDNLDAGANRQFEQPCAGMRMLIVDDMPINLKILSSMLGKAGAETDTVPSGAQALALLRQQHYDMLLTDLWMSEMNGEELAAEVRKNRDLQSMPIIAITADVEYKNNFDIHDFVAVLTKPITTKTLLEAISLTKYRIN